MSSSSSSARTCLKCGYERRSQDVGSADSCPSCGAIYSKVEAALKSREEAANFKPAMVGAIPYVPEYVDDDRRRLTHTVYLLYLLPTGISTLLGYSLVKSIREDHRDEIAAAHNEWQVATLSSLVYVVGALLVMGLVLAIAQGGFWFTHDEGLHLFARRGGLGLLILAGAVYAWVLLRTLRGWLALFRAEGP
jgi:uncharacterized membrane protein/predicted RNA-binding Zn-ribbon protein involved in translation (DUF1610 family)